MTGGVISNEGACRPMAQHKAHINSDGMLSRFMKRLFIASHIGRPPGRTSPTDRNSQLPVFVLTFYSAAIFCDTSLTFTPPAALNCHFRPEAWNSRS